MLSPVPGNTTIRAIHTQHCAQRTPGGGDARYAALTPEAHRQQVGAVLVRRGAEVQRSRGVPAVGHPLPTVGLSVGPAMRPVTQSCGNVSVTRAAISGSFSAVTQLGQRERRAGTNPTASTHACGPPSSAVRARVCGAERVSFHSSASCSTVPSASIATMPCCASTAMASTPSSPPTATVSNACHQYAGSTAVAIRVTRAALAHHLPGLASHDDLRRLRARIDPGDQRPDSRCSPCVVGSSRLVSSAALRVLLVEDVRTLPPSPRSAIS